MPKNSSLQWSLFSALSKDLLYAILKLRSDIFVVEQKCAYPDLDEVDQKAYHGLLYDGEKVKKLIGYVRVYQKDNGNWTFGRVVIEPAFRNKKLGIVLVKEALDKIKELKSEATVVISAQAHLKDYYQKFGFVCISKPYDDFGIMHIDMRLVLK